MMATSNVQVTTTNASLPFVMTTSNDSSGLAEAVAALNVPRTSCPAKILSQEPTPSVLGSPGIDSGYASQSSTPESYRNSFVDGGSVVKGSRLWPTRKTVKLKPFDKPIS